MNDHPDPYLDQIREEEIGDLQDWGKGCLLGSLLPVSFLVGGIILGSIFFRASSEPFRSNQVLGLASAVAALGLILGFLSFLRAVAPGVYLRGLFGLPDLPLSPRSERLGVYNIRGLKIFTGIVAGVVVFFAMLALVSFMMNVNERLGNALIWVGLLLGPLVGVLAGSRTALRPPLEPTYE